MTRRAARERILQTLQVALDHRIPADDSRPLKGSRFIDFENQAETLDRQVIPVVLEERGTRYTGAKVGLPGPRPHCGSPRVSLQAGRRKRRCIRRASRWLCPGSARIVWSAAAFFPLGGVTGACLPRFRRRLARRCACCKYNYNNI